MDTLDQIHVVSDLHLGGIPGHQICNQGAALAQVIDHLASTDPGQRVGLVLNGDVVDFLAAEDPRYFDPTGAVDKLEKVFVDPAFAPVWDALARFVRRDRRVLVVVLGNHDVELALPPVQAHLLDRLCRDDAAARGRVRLATDGSGYPAKIGGQRVLCIHGNDADPWNVVDHAELARLVKKMNEGAPPPELEPNAGTRLVIDVMNSVKAKYPFVDLLKPETVAVPSVLVALPAEYHANLLAFAKIALRLLYDGARRQELLSGDLRAALPAGPPPEVDGYRALDLLTGGRVSRHAKAPARESVQLLAQANDDFAGGRTPAELTGARDVEESLGMGGLVLDKIEGKDPREDLREALDGYLASDTTYRFDAPDDAFAAHDAKVGPGVRFLVTGHTHLERRLLRDTGVYFNSGTWIRLIRLSREMLASAAAFDPVYVALGSGRLEALDAVPGLVEQRRTVVSIWTEGDRVHGELRHAAAAGEGASAPWTAVPGTRYSCPAAAR